MEKILNHEYGNELILKETAHTKCSIISLSLGHAIPPIKLANQEVVIYVVAGRIQVLTGEIGNRKSVTLDVGMDCYIEPNTLFTIMPAKTSRYFQVNSTLV